MGSGGVLEVGGSRARGGCWPKAREGLRVRERVLVLSPHAARAARPSEQKCANTPARALCRANRGARPLHRRLRRVSRAGENRRPGAPLIRGRFIQYGAQRWRRARVPRPASCRRSPPSPRPPAAAQAGREGARRTRARPITPARRAARPCSRRLSATAARRGPSPSARSASRASTSTPRSPGAPRFRRP